MESVSCKSETVQEAELLYNSEEKIENIDSVVNEVLALLATDEEKFIKKFDSCASVGVTGDESRLKVILTDDDSPSRMIIRGFNGSASNPVAVGLNEDGMKEYLVPQMSKKLALLCAHAYASQGAAILTKDGGLVVKLTQSELDEFLEFIQQYPVIKRLIVKNRTYEVVEEYKSPTIEEVQQVGEEVMSNTATRYFNTKVNVSNITERILCYLLSGFSFNDLYKAIKYGSLRGFHPDLTISALNHFSHRYGTTPDIIRLANPRSVPYREGLMDQPEDPKAVGDEIEIDIAEPDFNEIRVDKVELRNFLNEFYSEDETNLPDLVPF